MTRIVYFTDEQGQYAGKREVGNDYELGYGELFDQPLIHPAFYSDNGWINGEEPIVDIPTPEPSGPSPEMLAINELGIQLAKHLAGGD